MMFAKPIAAIAALTALCVCAPALAAPFSVTFTGTVSGTDNVGLFGVPGVVANAPFTGIFVYDTSLGNFVNLPLGQEVYGGASWSTISPVSSASLSVNGTAFGFTPNGNGVVAAQPDALGNVEFLAYANKNTFPGGYLQLMSTLSSIPLSVTSAFSVAGVTPGSLFVWDQNNLDTTLFLTTESVTVAPLGVPEPVTLSMFAAGLLGAGALRRRRLVRA
jgi:hypothetical protein